MKVPAVDPGQTGALAILDGSEVLLVKDLPVHLVSTGKKTLRPELDLHGLHAMLARFTPYDHAFVEKVAARPGQGVTGVFRFGMSYGSILGVITTMGVPMTLIRPQEWPAAGPHQMRSGKELCSCSQVQPNGKRTAQRDKTLSCPDQLT